MGVNEAYKEWRKRKSEVVTPENFSTEEEVKAITDSFDEIPENTELNPEFHEGGYLAKAFETKGMHYYARTSHANTDALEKRIKALEVGNLKHNDQFECISFASGMAALTAAIQAFSDDPQERFVQGMPMYISTMNVLDDKGNGKNYFGQGPAHKFDMSDHKKLERFLSLHMISAIIFENITNPTLDYTDIRKISNIAHKYDVPVIVDNTLLTSYGLEPFRLGADIVALSLTKYHSGEGDVMGGALIFPSEFYERMSNIKKNQGAILDITAARNIGNRLHDFGERTEAHFSNARKLYDAIKLIEGVDLPEIDHLAEQTRKGYFGALFPFIFTGEGNEDKAYDQSMAFTKYLIENNDGTVKHAVSFGEPKTTIVSYSGQIVDKNEIKNMGAPLGLVRVGVGREKDFQKVIGYIVEGIKQSK